MSPWLVINKLSVSTNESSGFGHDDQSQAKNLTPSLSPLLALVVMAWHCSIQSFLQLLQWEIHWLTRDITITWHVSIAVILDVTVYPLIQGGKSGNIGIRLAIYYWNLHKASNQYSWSTVKVLNPFFLNPFNWTEWVLNTKSEFKWKNSWKF